MRTRTTAQIHQYAYAQATGFANPILRPLSIHADPCLSRATSRNTKVASKHHLNPLLLLFVRCLIRFPEGQQVEFNGVAQPKRPSQTMFWLRFGAQLKFCTALLAFFGVSMGISLLREALSTSLTRH
jgi:hypothetical protein